MNYFYKNVAITFAWEGPKIQFYPFFYILVVQSSPQSFEICQHSSECGEIKFACVFVIHHNTLQVQIFVAILADLDLSVLQLILIVWMESFINILSTISLFLIFQGHLHEFQWGQPKVWTELNAEYFNYATQKGGAYVSTTENQHKFTSVLDLHFCDSFNFVSMLKYRCM